MKLTKMETKGDQYGRRMSFPQDNASHSVFQRKPRNLTVGSNNNIEEENKVIRAAVLGKDGVGKTAFTVRLLTRRYIGEYDGTLESWYQHRVDIEGKEVLFHVFDTAGKNCKEKIDTCASLDIVFVLYSITDRSSFQEATLIVKYLHETKNIPSSKIFLIASKADQKRHTEVTEFEGKLFAVNMGCSFHQLSNSEDFSEHSKVLKQAYLRVSLGHVQKAPKSPLMRRLKGGFKNKGQTVITEHRNRSGSVEF
ncbi:ras-related and estrogen-regulated growth inhibitor-like [Stylophora pistillata]|uniref:small monomeric GTPase n=1 Tax=Stylophora pistillata TaxID=50429 RepID=A0A2B4S8I7_STYPI|nr:ras-related and estrogen-regulated growth inhibitor-like [Stylophora pistillata]XP_022791947.1 ras-related and estrogen-regulated growth inhibitor-like [Stylophora pistillata]PFX24842.1 Ras-like protein family member 11B [Stylophora pistillata]